MSLSTKSVFWLVLFLFEINASVKQCYWNAECPYLYFSTKTPYETVRGDLRDYVDPPNCEPISVWSIIRHGNRNPGGSVTRHISTLHGIKNQIIENFENGNSELCAQDVEDLRKWKWNRTIESFPSHLTSVGYQELYDIGKRVRERFQVLLNNGTTDDYYFRSGPKHRAVASVAAFVNGFSEGLNFKVRIEDTRKDDVVVQPFEGCERFHHDLKYYPVFNTETDIFMNSTEVLGIIKAVHRRIGFKEELTSDIIWTFYEMCRFERSWTVTLKSPWCALFSNEDLEILEYRDDVKRYHKNGYGTWFNPNLGALPLKDLYENFLAVTQGNGKKIVSYFSHATAVEMIFTALDMYKDSPPLMGSKIQLNRRWRTSIMDPMANNVIAILYSCQESGAHPYKFQLLHNEKLSGICPETGCTWEQFLEKFQRFSNANLEFCNLDYKAPTTQKNIEDNNTMPNIK